MSTPSPHAPNGLIDTTATDNLNMQRRAIYPPPPPSPLRAPYRTLAHRWPSVSARRPHLEMTLSIMLGALFACLGPSFTLEPLLEHSNLYPPQSQLETPPALPWGPCLYCQLAVYQRICLGLHPPLRARNTICGAQHCFKALSHLFEPPPTNHPSNHYQWSPSITRGS